MGVKKGHKANGAAAVQDQPDGSPQNRRVTGENKTPEHMAEIGKGTRFKPGNNMNPGGRPKRNPYTAALINMADKPLPEGFRRALEAKGVASLLPENATVADGAAVALNATLITMGKGSVQAGALIMDRVEGKIPQPLSGQLDVTMSMRDKTSEELHEIVNDYIRSLEEAQREESTGSAAPKP